MSFVRNRTAERQRWQGAHPVESRDRLGGQFFAQRGQHRPRRGGQWQVKGAALAVLGGYKGGHSSAENGPPLLCRGVRRKRRRAGAARGRVVDLGTATRETGGKAGYAENMSRAAAVNAQRERVLLFSLSSFCDPFQAARL